MATSKLTPAAPSPESSFNGSTITDLEKMVERCLVSGPLMTVGQIRILLRVEQACNNCDATGIVESRGLSPEVNQDRCPDCRGRGYIIPEVQQ